MSKQLIYAADDEQHIREILYTFLTDAGYDVVVFPTGDALYEQFKNRACDLVLLDIMMPGTDGVGICKKIRQDSQVPIVLLTAKDGDDDYILGLNSGSDDYMVKPFRPSILVARVKALFRRIAMERMVDAEAPEEVMQFADLVYSEEKHATYCREQNLNLTETELALMKMMIQANGRAVSRDELLEVIWGTDSIETRVTDETVRRVRKKIRDVNSRTALMTVWGFGYRLEQIDEE